MLYKRHMDKALRNPAVNSRCWIRGWDVKTHPHHRDSHYAQPSILNIITLIDTKLVLFQLQTAPGLITSSPRFYTAYTQRVNAVYIAPLPSSFLVTVSVVPAIAAALAQRENRGAKEIMESSLKLYEPLALPAGVGPPYSPIRYSTSCTPTATRGRPPAFGSAFGIASYFCLHTADDKRPAPGERAMEKLASSLLPVGGIIKITVNWFLVGTPAINVMGAPIGSLFATCSSTRS